MRTGDSCEFFLHELRHLSLACRERADLLKDGEHLRVVVELNNPATRIAIPLLTEDYQMVGWAPRYLVAELLWSVGQAPLLEAHVAKVNPSPAPLNRRVLVRFRGQMAAGEEPMSTPDFSPLVG